MNDSQANPAASAVPTDEQKAAAKAAEEARIATLVGTIQAKFNNKVDVKEYKFRFKKQDIVDSNDKPTGEFTQRPTVELHLPVPSLEGIVDILQSGNEKWQSLLLEAVEGMVTDRTRDLLNDTLKDEDVNQDNFDLNLVSWDTIANLPKAERRGGGIAKEIWDDFAKDYGAVMPAATGKKVEAIANHVKIFLQKFNTVKSAKPILKKLKEALGIYVNASPNAETYADCVEFLTKKAEALLAVDDATLLENL